MATFDKVPAAYGATNNILTVAGGAGIDNLAQSVTVGDTLVFGSNMVNGLRVAFNRTSINRFTPPFFDPTTLGVKNFHSYFPGEMVLTVTGGFNISAGTATTGIFWTNAYQVADDVTLVRGQHQIGLGGSYAYWKSNQTSHARSSGNWTINGQTTGRGLSDLMVGAVSGMEHGNPNLLVMDMTYVGLYAQDSWRAMEGVTLNYGLRWEPFLGQQMLFGGASIFDKDNFNSGVRSQVFVNAPPGFLYPGDAGFPEGQSGYNKRWLEFSPRVGVAWDVTGDGRLALRALYSLAPDFPSGDYMNINASAPPWGNRSLVTTTIFDDPYSVVGGSPHPVETSRDTAFPNFGAFGAMDPNIQPPRVQSWNVTFEKQSSRTGRRRRITWPLLGSSVGADRHQPRCLPGSWCLRHQRRLVPGVQHERQSQPAPIAGARESPQRRRHRLPRPARRRGLPDVSRSPSHHDTAFSQWGEHQRQLTLSKCEGTATPGSFPQISAGYRTRGPGHGQGPLRSGPHAPVQRDGGLHDTGVQ